MSRFKKNERFVFGLWVWLQGALVYSSLNVTLACSEIDLDGFVLVPFLVMVGTITYVFFHGVGKIADWLMLKLEESE